MKNRWKNRLAILLMTVVMSVMPWLPGSTCEVKAEEEVYPGTDISSILKWIETCSQDGAGSCVVQLQNDIDISDADLSSGQVFQLTDETFTLDLNGCKLDGSKCSKSGTVFYNNGGTLTITDSVGGGKVICPSNGVAVRTEAGTLNISGGSFENASQCLSVENSTVNITGGTFKTNGNGQNDIALLITGNNSILTISGDSSFESSYGTIWVQELVKTGSSLTIKSGTFTANDNGSFSYACYVGGACDFNVSGGTFNLCASNGSSLFIDAVATDEQINIAGGVYNGRIGRGVSDSSRQNYTAFYGDENGNEGIFGKGSVLTNNTFYNQGNVMFSQGNVSVVSGSLIKLNTQRSTLETYTENEWTLADTADYYSLVPVSVGIDGTVYANSEGNGTPVVDTARVTNGNSYEFNGWYDDKGMEYASVGDYVSGQGVSSSAIVLNANWNAKVGTVAGLEEAIQNIQAVKGIELTDHISLTDSIIEDGQNEASIQRVLNLGGKIVSYDGSVSDNPAFVLNGIWNIKNGTIESNGQACLQVDGTAVIESLNCKTKDFTYAVGFSNVTAASSNKIISGTFETTSKDGYALWTTSATGTGTAEDITNLYKDANASSRDTRIEGMNVYLDAPKLIVSQEPITYIENAEDVNMGNSTYGDAVSSITKTISNQGYIGDIVVTGITVDNPAFTVTGETEEKSLLGGSADTYSYVIKTVEKLAPGTYEGTIGISYVKMDATTGVCRQKVVVTVLAKQLAIAEPALTKTKTYDGTTAAGITAGALNGVVAGDDVSVTAAAKYNSASAGSNKTISVSYTLTGADKDNYLAPAEVKYSGGVINKAAGKASVSIADYHVGENAKVKISSSTNGTKSVKYYFKKKGASDSTYTTSVPGNEGSYTLKAVFAATTNYKEVEATANFKVSYIDTPKQPYTLKGTKGENGWYISSVSVYPASGYTISTTQSGTYKSYCTVSSTAEPVIYLKNANGAVTKAVKVEKIQIDKEAPKITGIANGETHYSDELEAVVSDTNLESVTLNGKTVSFAGQSASVSLSPSETKYTIVAKDKAGNKVQYTVGVEEAWMKDGIVSDGKKKLVKKKAYKLGSGQWKVSGDNTVYNGNMNFYVSADGEYDFKKQ